MLSVEKNQLLCSVEAGTRGGELFRSMWLPALLSSQLPEPGCSPVRIKLLGEELLAIRIASGKAGIIQSRCAHRGAPLFFGKMEETGIRCAYHGWLYTEAGKCIDMPNEPNKNLCRNVKMRSYQTVEKAGIIWVYMGAGQPPALPQFPWIDLPEENLCTTVWLQETNWFQGAEGEIDSSHVSVLHKSNTTTTTSRVHRHWTSLDPSPKFFLRDTQAGFMSIARRNADKEFYWRITQWMAPMYSLIPSAAWPIGGRAWVPIDNENTYCWDFSYSVDGPLPEAFHSFKIKGLSFPPEYAYQAFQLNNGSMIDTYIPRRRMSNDYLIDRHLQQTFSTTGIHGVNDQDRAMQEGMGRIADRSREMLTSSDIAIVTARRRVLDILEDDDGISKFRDKISDGQAFNLSPVDVVLPMDTVEEFLAYQGLA